MSVKVETRVAEPGNEAFLEDAWRLKERIRREEGVLRQRHRFFRDAYRRATARLLFDGDELVGFSTTRRDGYILFLAIAPEHRGRGFGRRLVAEVADAHNSVTCHARTTNEEALGFYDRLGFERVRRIRNYYEDGGDAYYLRLGEPDGLARRLSEFLKG